MDLAKVKSITVLGYNFGLHILRGLVSKKGDQAALFRNYFREDRISSMTAREHEQLFGHEGCVACGLCPSHCRVMEASGGRFRGPMHIAVTASRSHPDFLYDLDSIQLCAACGQCEPVCPESVPVAQICAAMRAWLFRVADEALPAVYREARKNLAAHGNIYGPVPAVDLETAGDTALVAGPFARQNPDTVRKAFETLKLLGLRPALVEEGTAGGLAASLGLAPDTAWIDKLAGAGHKKIVALDPEVWIELKKDGRFADRLLHLGEALLGVAGSPRLDETLKGAASVHDPWPFARGSGAWRDLRGLLEKAGVKLVEMAEHGPWSPPLGWEGGLTLVDPALAREVARMRLADAKSAGADLLLAFSSQDAMMLKEVRTEYDPRVVFILDAAHDALKHG